VFGRNISVKVEGLRELEQALGELPEAVAKRTLNRVLKRAAEPIRAAAAAAAPKRTGRLSKSIIVSPRLTRSQRRQAERHGFAEMFVGSKSPLAHLIEFGTAHSAPNAFLRRAWDAHKDEALAIIKTELGGEIKRAAARLARKTTTKR
jgi:HK97 gp10 family phage protein